MKYREELGKMIQKITTIPLPNTSVMPLIDFEVYKYLNVYYGDGIRHVLWFIIISLAFFMVVRVLKGFSGKNSCLQKNIISKT